MRHSILCPTTGELLVLTDLRSINCQSLLECSALYKVILNLGENVRLYLNHTVRELKTGEILFCKPLNNVEILNRNHNVKVLAFNKDFYPIESEEDQTTFIGFGFLASSTQKLLC